jgi:hypothetical protein
MPSLLLVDLENVHRLDTSGLSSDFEVIIFTGAGQKAVQLGAAPTHRIGRPKIAAQRVMGFGKNALDFHIAFHLGRVFETAKQTTCYILSRDKGFDPLLLHLNSIGLRCRRLESLREISCSRCDRAPLVEHNGGMWCALCGKFSVAPDPSYTAHIDDTRSRVRGIPGEIAAAITCAYCHQKTDCGTGIYDDGEWMCGGCISSHSR